LKVVATDWNQESILAVTRKFAFDDPVVADQLDEAIRLVTQLMD
jgi:hypothetical protein